MNLYKISRDEHIDYDTYDSAVVAAENEDKARNTHPSNWFGWEQEGQGSLGVWTKPENVKVELIGQAVPHIEAGVIVASFNAG